MTHTQTIITASTHQELEDAFSVRTQVFVEEQKVSIELERDHEDEHAIHFVLYHNQKPTGAARIRLLDTYAKIERVCTLRNSRGTGAGSALMKAIEVEISKQGFQLAKLNAQTQAAGFYERLGYTACSNEFMDAGMPHITMEKSIG
ncbi:GNAT family N-acetyltransferase [Alkalicoccobacillus murimartini]|uniref:GNAT family N-acyltransferase n=1 Tax=Alkalicoccobacillus murimartini TaxID=171685 RepID=A0ABT9YCN2_9BACI|nr:GNAT family N-acetyltransferase [Alkalicoccobacillus murimartini]MDQ0205611.1 putative GNAT family N-acyltransferase [Alkalicoccobacillus murimartini]